MRPFAPATETWQKAGGRHKHAAAHHTHEPNRGTMTTTTETLSAPCTQPAIMSAESLMDSTLKSMQLAFYLMTDDNLADACKMWDLAPADHGTFNSLRNMYNVCEVNMRVIGRWLALPQDGSGMFVAAHGADMQWPENLTALFTKATTHTPRAWSLHS